MKVIKKGTGPRDDRTNAPIFYGGKVEGEAIVGGGQSTYYNFNIVHFSAGAKNKFHTHTSDQILFVTDGTGIVANEEGEETISTGDTAFIPAGEKHWHGATDESDFSHVSLTHPTSQTEVFD